MSSKDKLLQSPEKSHLYFFLAGPTKEQSEKLRQSKSKHDREIVELWQEYRLVSIGNSAFGSKTRAKAQGGRDDVRWCVCLPTWPDHWLRDRLSPPRSFRTTQFLIYFFSVLANWIPISLFTSSLYFFSLPIFHLPLELDTMGY